MINTLRAIMRKGKNVRTDGNVSRQTETLRWDQKEALGKKRPL